MRREGGKRRYEGKLDWKSEQERWDRGMKISRIGVVSSEGEKLRWEGKV